jgi:hypothetical protein
MPHPARNTRILKDLPKQRMRSTGRTQFGRGETVYLAVAADAERPTEQLGKITDVDDLTGARYVDRYDDSGNTYFDRELHKLITVRHDDSELSPSVRVRRYFHEIRLWDNAKAVLGELQGHVITERFVQLDKGTPKFPPDCYVVEIVYRGQTRFQLKP